MKKKYYQLLMAVLMLVINVSSYGQTQNYNQTDQFLNANAFWAFYNNNGLDFSGGAPVHDSTALAPVMGLLPDFTEGLSAVSDPNTGSLLFYTDGRRIFNRNDSLMPNGDSLWGNFNLNTVQGVCIVPVVGETGKYYVFSLGTTTYLNDHIGLYYSVVDMSLENGMGNVVDGSKNIPLDTSTLFNEAMIAIPGNNCNVWLLTHEAATKKFLAFEISAAGVSTMPVVSNGLYNSGEQSHHLSVSPDRTKVMMTDLYPPYLYQLDGLTNGVLGPAQYSELSMFDANTGEISNPVPIVAQFIHPTVPIPEGFFVCGIYGSAFSPNGNLLYLNQYSITTNNHVLLAQIDISVHDSIAINSSHQIIDTLLKDNQSVGGYSTAIRSYRDSIYVISAGRNLVGRVNQPNSVGLLCDFDSAAIQLPSPYVTHPGTAALPNDVVYPFSVEEVVVLDTQVCSNLVLQPAIRDASLEYEWSDNSTDSLLQIVRPGDYWVRYTYFEDNCIYQRTDTFKARPGNITPSPQININVDILGTSSSYASYQWMLDGTIIQGATDSTYTVSENGDYQVIVSTDFGCVDTSEVYRVENSGIYAADNGSIDIQIYPNPFKNKVYIDYKDPFSYSLYQVDGKVILNNATGNSVDTRNLSPGFYLLKVYGRDGQVIYHTKLVKMQD